MLKDNFRGLTKTGKMVYGCLLISVDGRTAIVCPPKIFEGTWKKVPMLSVDEVIPETVGMKLGWKNRYDQELWEGDILESEAGWRRVIVYDPVDHWGWCFPTGADISNAYHWKVVGNIHQHPNLRLGEPENESN